MAVYEYRCESCGDVVEIRMGMHDAAPSLSCAHCGSTGFRKMISAPALVKSQSGGGYSAPEECQSCCMPGPAGPCGGGMCGMMD